MLGHHCLSAFSAFPTGRTTSQHVQAVTRVSIAFRRSVRSRRRASRQPRARGNQVSIAFRRSVRSRPCLTSTRPPYSQSVSIAFRRSVRSRLFAVREEALDRLTGLHCLSAFSAFPTSPTSTR